MTLQNDANGLVIFPMLLSIMVNKDTAVPMITGILAVTIAVMVVINDFLFSLFIIYTIPESTITPTSGAITALIKLKICSNANRNVKVLPI